MAALRIAFVIDRIGAIDLLSVPTVAALTRAAGHEAALFEYGRHPQRTTADLATFRPDVIAYSIASNEAGRYLAINRALKNALPFFSVFGGAHPTFVPSFIEEDGVDALCRGEGDISFPQMLDAFGSDAMYGTPNFCFKRPGGETIANPMVDLISDLDAFPFPARDLVYAKSYFMANNPIKAFMAGRGCPFSCAYCFNSAYNRLYRGKGRVVRAKSVSHLLEEIRDVAQRYPLSFVRFHDDVFGLDPEWLDEFAARFPKEIGTPFSCYVHPHMAKEAYVRSLKAAGCHAVCTAIECGNERLRNEVLGRRVSNEEIVAACARFKEAGIRLFSFNMLGLPGETEEDMFETIRLNRRIGVDFADASIFQPFPGTPAHAYCLEHGYIAEGEGQFENIYSESILSIDPVLKRRIYVIHKMFSWLAGHPNTEPLARYVPRFADRLLNHLSRIHYGHALHKRIYNSCIPWRVRWSGAKSVLFSRNRI